MKNKILYTAIVALLIFFLGFGVAKMTTTVKTKTSTVTSYVPIPYPVIKKVDNPVPYAVHDSIPYEVINHDTVPAKVDTAAILLDYNKVKKYPLDFSNDTLGVFKVDATVYRNKLITATSFIKPIIKTVTTTTTVYKVPLVQFYGILGSSIDFKTNKASAGIDLKQKYLIGVSGVRFNDQYQYTFDIGLKF